MPKLDGILETAIHTGDDMSVLSCFLRRRAAPAMSMLSRLLPQMRH